VVPLRTPQSVLRYVVDPRSSICSIHPLTRSKYILPPKSVIYFGCVGKDKYADILAEAAKKAGLEVRYRVDEKEPTGRCGVVVTGHDRSLVTDLAAANCYKLDHLKEHWDIVEKSKAYFVGGYHLTVCVPAIMALAEEAAAKNKVCSIPWQRLNTLLITFSPSLSL
jgi:adenosine kinase